MGAHENAESAEEREWNDPVAAVQLDPRFERKVRAEADGKPAVILDADVVREDRLQHGEGEEAERRDVADEQPERSEEAHDGGRRQMPDGAHDGDEASRGDGLVDRALGRVRLRDAQRRAELGQNLLERRALVRRAVGRGDPLAQVRLDLPHRVADDVGREKRLERSLEHEQVAVDARFAGLSEIHDPTFLIFLTPP